MVAYIDDEQYGRVLVYTRRGMRKAIARWDGDHLKLTIPFGLSLTQVRDLLDSMRTGIDGLKRTTVNFAIGQVVHGFHCQVTIDRQKVESDYYTYGLNDDEHGYLNVPMGSDLDSEVAKRTISGGLLWVMERFAKLHLLPYAIEVARDLGIDLTKERLSVGRGLRKLGHCSRADGSIQLSRCLMFLPEHLIRYVICHELAHLQHGNHSPEFHALVDRYTGGQESQLEMELRHFVWPILR